MQAREPVSQSRTQRCGYFDLFVAAQAATSATTRALAGALYCFIDVIIPSVYT
jgi:hypothetical protein